MVRRENQVGVNTATAMTAHPEFKASRISSSNTGNVRFLLLGEDRIRTQSTSQAIYSNLGGSNEKAPNAELFVHHCVNQQQCLIDNPTHNLRLRVTFQLCFHVLLIQMEVGKALEHLFDLTEYARSRTRQQHPLKSFCSAQSW